MSDIPTTIIKTPSARQVRAIRAWLGIPQGEFAKQCKISVSALADFEIGKRATKPETRAAIGLAVKEIEFVKFNGNSVLLPE